MSDEATVNISLQINKGKLQFQSRPTAFKMDVSVAKGPTPGAITVTTVGTDIDLSQLTTPGLCRLMNLDENNSIKIGIWNPDQNEFYPLIRLKPGHFNLLTLDPDINEEYENQTGTGTTGELNTFRAKAENADAILLVECFSE